MSDLPSFSKSAVIVFKRIIAETKGFGLEIEEKDFSRPWGGFVRFTEDSFERFLTAYWEGVDVPKVSAKRDPKILMAAPHQRLSLQRHRRRSEQWRCIDGPAEVLVGENPDDLESHRIASGETIQIPCGHAHRLVAPGDYWVRVAEIWEHVDPETPSDEDDIERLQDDYGR